LGVNKIFDIVDEVKEVFTPHFDKVVPIWTILLGWRLLKEKNAEVALC
jgi:hypothetical protein